MSKNIDFHSK